jgi:hypothetical protein
MFRTKYLDYDELTTQLSTWAKQYPDLVRVTSIGKTAGGREIPLLAVGHNLHDARPAVWVDGNMHASELCGSSVALAIAEDVLAIHGGGKQGAAAALPPHMAEAIRETIFYIVPRISPDGAEEVLTTGRYVRSSPADERRHKGHAYWEATDVDGDGRMGYMRKVSPDGELVELRDESGAIDVPGVLVPRLPEDPGPYYKLYPEGRIANFDGQRIPDPYFLSDNQYDFNRNFPYQWAPEPEQEGAGHFPGSAPETQAIMRFVTDHPHIFVWLNLHTFGGVLIRPLGDKPDHKMNQGDLAVFRQVEAWMTQFTGYPTVSGFHEFLYLPETPIKGDMTDYAYHQRGCIAYVVELWDIFHQLGIERKKPFVDHYTHLDRKDFIALARWDRDVNQGRVFRPWRRVSHPQLGEVEVGGLDIGIGISNPPYEKLGEVCAAQSAAFLRVAALVPRVKVEVLKRERTGRDHTRIELRVSNTGYLATYGLPSARSLPHSEPLRLTVQCEEGVTVVAPGESIVQIGHLDGWGTGLYGGISIFAPWTRGNAHEKFVTLVARGRGQLRIQVGSCRVGYQALEVGVD